MPIPSFKINFYFIFSYQSLSYPRMHLPEQKITAEYGSREPACSFCLYGHISILLSRIWASSRGVRTYFREKRRENQCVESESYGANVRVLFLRFLRSLPELFPELIGKERKKRQHVNIRNMMQFNSNSNSNWVHYFIAFFSSKGLAYTSGQQVS